MQLSLFDTGKKCDICQQDPGAGKNRNLWNGFYDQDTGQYVCWSCQREHYRQKAGTVHRDQYSEFPVSLLQIALQAR